MNFSYCFFVGFKEKKAGGRMKSFINKRKIKNSFFLFCVSFFFYFFNFFLLCATYVILHCKCFLLISFLSAGGLIITVSHVNAISAIALIIGSLTCLFFLFGLNKLKRDGNREGLGGKGQDRYLTYQR